MFPTKKVKFFARQPIRLLLAHTETEFEDKQLSCGPGILDYTPGIVPFLEGQYVNVL